MIILHDALIEDELLLWGRTTSWCQHTSQQTLEAHLQGGSPSRLSLRHSRAGTAVRTSHFRGHCFNYTPASPTHDGLAAYGGIYADAVKPHDCEPTRRPLEIETDTMASHNLPALRWRVS